MLHNAIYRPKYSTNVRDKNSATRLGTRTIGTLWRWAPGITERLARNLLFAPSRYKASHRERHLLESSRPFNLRVNGRNIHGWQWGRGPGVLLVHGWNGAGIQLHGFISACLAAGYRPVAFDGPGHGRSEGRTSSYFEMTDAVRALLSRRDLAIRALVGHSFGAAAVVNSLAHENLVLPAVLMAPALKLQEMLTHTFDRYGLPEAMHVQMIAGYEARFGYSLERHNPARLLPDLNAPVMIAHDRRDTVVPYADSRSLSRRIPCLHLHTTDGLGHKRILNDTTAVEKAMDFIRARIR